jgi:hypothetical protein
VTRLADAVPRLKLFHAEIQSESARGKEHSQGVLKQQEEDDSDAHPQDDIP